MSQLHFGEEKRIAVIIHNEFTRECRCGGKKLSNVKSFTILLLGEGLTSFSINNRTNFFKLSWVSFLRTRKIFKLNLVLILVLVPTSKVL